MTSATFIGIHAPSALDFLIRESLLPPNPPESLYRWETYNDNSENGDLEEVVTTSNCVVWSQGGVIYRVHRLHHEGQQIVCALLTWFETDEPLPRKRKPSHAHRSESMAKSYSPSRARTSLANEHGAQSKQNFRGQSRALVIVLKRQAHIYFQHGSSHVVNLPIEVEFALPAPTGILLQRKVSQPQTAPLYSPVLTVPPNSLNVSQRTAKYSPNPSDFLASRYFHSHSSLRRNSEPRKFNPTVATEHSQASAKFMPLIFVMTDPLLELGVVAEVAEYSGHHTTLQPFQGEDKMLHISLLDRYLSASTPFNQQLLFFLTFNSSSQCYTAWCGYYLDSAPIWNTSYSESSEGISVEQSPSGNYYSRSSFGNVSTRRRRSGKKESLIMKPSATAKVSRSKIERISDTFHFEHSGNTSEDRGVVSYIDSPAKKSASNRRTSSMVARAELSTQELDLYKDWPANTLSGGSATPFHDPRDVSFEAHRLGTVSASENFQYANRSSTAPVDMMEVDDWDQAQSKMPGIGGGPEDLPITNSQRPLDPTKKNLVVARLFDVPSSYASQDVYSCHHSNPATEDIEVFESFSSDKNMISFFILNRRQTLLSEIRLCINRLSDISNGSSNAKSWEDTLKHIASNLTSNSSVRISHNVVDAIKIVDKDVAALVALSKHEGKSLTLSVAPISPIRHKASAMQERPTSFQNCYEATTVSLRKPSNPGYSRTSFEYSEFSVLTSKATEAEDILAFLSPSNRKLRHAGALGEFDVVNGFGSRRRYRLRLRPRDSFVNRILNLSNCIIGDASGRNLLSLWREIYSSYLDQNLESEWTALAITLLTLFISFSNESNSSIGEVLEKDLYQPYSLKASRTLARSSSWTWALDGSNITSIYHGQDSFRSDCAAVARKYLQSHDAQGRQRTTSLQSLERNAIALTNLVLCLHIVREEELLNILSPPLQSLSPLLAQIVSWLGYPSWAEYYNSETDNLNYEGCRLCENELPYVEIGISFTDSFSEVINVTSKISLPFQHPPSVYEWLKHISTSAELAEDQNFAKLLRMSIYVGFDKTAKGHALAYLEDFTPSLRALRALTIGSPHKNSTTSFPSELVSDQYLRANYIETLPEGLAMRLRSQLLRRTAVSPTTLPNGALRDIDREDIELLGDRHFSPSVENLDRYVGSSNCTFELLFTNECKICARFTGSDLRSICSSNLDKKSRMDFRGPREILKIFFREDTRSLEPMKLLCPQLVPVAVMHPPSAFSEAQFLEAQQNHAKLVYTRTMAIVSGQALLEYNCHRPLPTQKLDILLFNTSCRMQPSGITVNADRSSFVEEKVSWAFFHAGVQAGLKITKDASDLDTSWLVLNKPADLGNRHAGLLLALGLNGHLRPVAKWLAFKYLTPKHDMTSIGLLLGWSASYFGSMDSLITRVLSVHLETLLPPGSAELNLNPMVQTAAIMGVGFLYYNSQHRRMSEKMLLEMEHVDAEPQAAPATKFYRNEGYRLAAGFALGFINLAKGANLRALRGLKLEDRLTRLATGPYDVDNVHILDQATAGATIAIALIFMKTCREDIAQKIGIPHTTRQFDSIRPDLLLLRVMASNIIMWHNIVPSQQWIWERLPHDLQLDMKPVPFNDQKPDTTVLDLVMKPPLSSSNLSLYNILAGSCWSIGLKYAGSGDILARNCLINYYDKVTQFLEKPSQTYDESVTRNALLRFQHLLVVAAALVMAGTGDIVVLRRTRVLHSTVTESSTFGFHQASHMAMGALFLGQGRFTFGTSNLAIASLICAFYPIFPIEVLDNRAHLQAFRHFWVFAVEARYILPRDVETHETIITPVEVILRSGESRILVAPTLLPDLESISRIYTRSDEYWQVVLDFENDLRHLSSFRKHHTIFLRRKSLMTQHKYPFSVALAQRAEPRLTKYSDIEVFEWLFRLDALAALGVGRTEVASIFPRGRAEEERDKKRLFLIDEGKDPSLDVEEAPPVTNLLDPKCTGIDDVLVLKEDVESKLPDRLRGLSLLFDWANKARNHGETLKWEEWIGDEALEALRAAVIKRILKDSLVTMGSKETMDGDVASAIASAMAID